MKLTVPCKITYSAEDKCWYVEAPGFYNGIMTDGETLEEAKNMATEAVTGLIESYLKHGDPFTIPPMPDTSDFYAIPLEPGLSFALWMRNHRKAQNMRQADVAEQLGIKPQVYQKLENPRTANPTLKTLRKVEKVFGEELVAL